MPDYYSPEGNFEVWNEKPDGYCTPEEWAEMHPAPPAEPPPLADVKAAKIAAIDANTSRLILAGFDYEVAGTAYRFGYDAEDQGNFTKATLAATLSIVMQQPFGQPWRGWRDGEPNTLMLDAQGMIALATFAGVNHQQGLLQSGWDLTAHVRECGTLAEVEAVVDDRE